MASVESLNTVQDLYIAYYQRPGDPSGLFYWASRLDTGTDLSVLEAQFGSAPESLALYGPINSSTIGTVIDSIYLALFNRAPDAAGKQFYIDGFNAGTFTPASIAYNILVGAQNSDAVAVNNKEIVADRFSETVDGRPFADPNFGQGSSFNATYAGDPDAVAARTWLKGVTADPLTIQSESQTVAFIQTSIANPGDPILNEVPGLTYVLTPTVDIINGTTGNDLVVGVFGSATAGENTYTVGDSINGSTGTDKLSLIAAGVVASPTGVTVKGIETIEVNDTLGATLDATSILDNPAINFVQTATGVTSKMTNAGLGSTYGLSGRGNLTVDFASTSGSADTAKASVTGAGASTSARSTVDVADGNTIEAVTLATSGSNFVTLNSGSAATKVTMTGSGTNNVAFGTMAILATIDASASTGTNTLGLGNQLNTGDVVKGGTGADTLSANFLGATLVNPTVSGVETLALDFDGNAIFNMSKTTGATTVGISGSKGSAEMTNAAAEVTKLNLSTQDTGWTDNDLTFTHATGVEGALTFTVGSTATSATAIQQDSVVLKGISSLTLNTVGTKVYDFDDLDVYGDPTAVTVNVGADGTMRIGSTDVHGEIGDITVKVGADATYSGGFYALAGGIGDVNFSVAAGGYGQSYIEAQAGGIGDVTYSVIGRNAEGNLDLGASGGSIGDMSLTVDGAHASGYFGARASGGSIGDINISQKGTHSVLGVYVSANAAPFAGDENDGTGNIGNITINVDGSDSYFSGYFTASGGDIGDVSITMAGASMSGNVYINASWVSGDLDNDGSADDYVRGGNVGDVTVDINGVGSWTDVIVTASGGDIGNVTYQLQGTGASGGLELYAYGFGTGSIGSGSPGGNIGAIDIQLGDDTNFSGNMGLTGATGPISILAGDNVSGRFSVSGGGSGTGALGDITLNAGSDTEFYINVSGFSGSTGAFTSTIGDDSINEFRFTRVSDVGPVSVTAGSAADVGIYASGYIGSMGAVTLVGGEGGSGYVDLDVLSDVQVFGGVDAAGWLGYLNVDLAGVGTGTTVTIGQGGSNVSGTGFADNIFGGAGVDVIFGDDGDDLIAGGGASDKLYGGNGKDTIQGDAGNDTITGGLGADIMGGGAGSDKFVIAAGDTGITVATADTIGGFATGADTLALGTAGSGTNYNEAAAAVASFAAAQTAADVVLDGTVIYAFQFDATNGYLFQDTNADGTADQVIVLVGLTSTAIAATDIVA